MAKLFELACRFIDRRDWEKLLRAAHQNGWINDQRVLAGNHMRFLCDHDWEEVYGLARGYGLQDIEETVLPLNIYKGSPDDPQYYYWQAIPRVQFVHNGDVIETLPLEATIPPLSGKELKEHALRVNVMVSLTYLSGNPLKDEDIIVAPAIDRHPLLSDTE